MAGRAKLLVACPDPETWRSLTSVLAQHGVQPVCCSSVSAARAFLERHPVCAIFCESRLADGSFRDVLRLAALAGQPVPVVVTSRLDDPAEYLEAMELGAFDYIARPYRRADVDWILSRALGRAAIVAA